MSVVSFQLAREQLPQASRRGKVERKCKPPARPAGTDTAKGGAVTRVESDLREEGRKCECSPY